MNIMPIADSVITACGAAALAGILLFLGLIIYWRRVMHHPLAPFWAGCGVFLLFALVLESIVHNLVLISPVGPAIFNNTLPYAIYGGLMAGLFEETGRLLAMRVLKKKYNNPDTPLVYGAGHGGIEVVAILTVTMVQNIVLAVMINNGLTEQILGSLEGAARAAGEAQLAAIAEISSVSILLAIAERILAVVIHVSLSVLVWQAATVPGKFRMYFAAIGLHAALDACAVLLSAWELPAIAVEGFIALFTALTAFLARRVYLAGK